MEECPTCEKEYTSLRVHLNKSYPSHIPDEWPTCHDCGNWYKKLGTHWSLSSCSYPEVNSETMDILTGVLMGDGWVDKDKKHCRVSIGVVKEEYLEFLDDELGKLSCGVELSKTAKESAELSGGNVNNHNNIYRLTTICHPKFDYFGEWYESGGKVWPENINLTPNVLINWYCCDGYYKNTSGDNYLTISLSSEIENREKVRNYFSQAGLPEPKFEVGENEINGTVIDKCVARWTVNESKKVWEYMGEPLPGFEYKWPEEF